MGKSKAPKYATTTVSTDGLFGSSTNNKKGTTYTGTDNVQQLGQEAWNGTNTSLANMNSNDYSNDANFKVYQDNWNRNMEQAYDTNVLSNLASRGLMRSSGLQSATNSFNNTMQNSLADLYDNYYNRQANNLSANTNTLSTLYNWITGLNNSALGTTSAVNNHNMQVYQANQSASSGLWGNLAKSVGSIAAPVAGSITSSLLKK